MEGRKARRGEERREEKKYYPLSDKLHEEQGNSF